MAELTPMMKQYIKIKEENPDCLLFFRLGDFYEMFHDDAKVGAQELGLTLTTRDRSKPEEERTPMCGVPYHSAQNYIARLIKRGYKVAICEQMEDPATAKGLVERDIVRIVTPGTAMDDVMLDENNNNYICGVYVEGDTAAVAVCDLSTGQFQTTPFDGADWLPHLCNQLSACPPSEAMLSPQAAQNRELVDFLRQRLDCLCQEAAGERFEPQRAMEALETCGLSPAGAPPSAIWRRGRWPATCWTPRKPTSPTWAPWWWSSRSSGCTWSWTSPPGATWSSPRPCAARTKRAPCCGCWTRPAPPWATG